MTTTQIATSNQTTSRTRDSSDTRDSPTWPFVAGTLTLISCFVVVVSDFVGWAVVEKHNPISETISRLAVGEQSWIMDVGLDAFAGGIALLAIGLFFRYSLGAKWKAANASLILASLSIFVISEYDQYQNFDGVAADIHYACCYLLYLFVVLAAALFGWELRETARPQSMISFGLAIFWFVGGPIFMFAAPDNIDGAIERGLGIALVVWVGTLASLLFKRCRLDTRPSS